MRFTTPGFLKLCLSLSVLLETSDSQNLSVQLKLRPTSAVGVLLALVHQDRVPLSIALADYNPDTDEWRDVSSSKIKPRVRVHKIVPVPCHNLNIFPTVFSGCQYILVTSGDVVLASSPAPLCDGQSHEIEVTISGNQTLLLVDGQPGRGQEAEIPFELLSQSSTFIGGLPGEHQLTVKSEIRRCCFGHIKSFFKKKIKK